VLRTNSDSLETVFANSTFESQFVVNLLLHLDPPTVDPEYVPAHRANGGGSLGGSSVAGGVVGGGSHGRIHGHGAESSLSERPSIDSAMSSREGTSVSTFT
jgi:hypothetical protein